MLAAINLSMWELLIGVVILVLILWVVSHFGHHH